MDTQAISQLISTIGFPIASFCWAAWMIQKERTDSRAEIQQIREEHSKESNEFSKVISENTAALTALKQLIEDKL